MTAIQSRPAHLVLADRPQSNPAVGLQAAPTSSDLLTARGMNADAQQKVMDIYAAARSSLDAGQARSFLLKLDSATLAQLQQAAALADPIEPARLSDEGATNILRPPGDLVDLDDDGFLEVGRARTFVFPPVNAPQAIKDAWDHMRPHMSEFEISSFSHQVMFVLAAPPASLKITDGMAKLDWNQVLDEMVYRNNLVRAENGIAITDRANELIETFRAGWRSAAR